MKPAILLPYTTYQNAPSKPLNELYDIPDDKAEREALLLKLFKEYVYDDEDMNITYMHEENDYSDMYICADDDVFLFVHFIE